MNLKLLSFTTERPANLPAYAGTPGVVTFVWPGASKALYTVPHAMRPRTVKVLVNHALETLAPFGIPDLPSWAIEVIEGDDDYQVDFVSSRGARLCVDAIHLTPNKCGVLYDYGITARVD